ncbi:unnamed protein product [Protopolystoma xenopodis]|uniref:Uncharacterized protein n=1 Tax=Protopolystoma xenopodis TaxID=117903 RepID=A0A3S5BMD7_9PLAT|nr:unnamed protein product [Protopolystoma xenopodis]
MNHISTLLCVIVKELPLKRGHLTLSCSESLAGLERDLLEMDVTRAFKRKGVCNLGFYAICTRIKQLCHAVLVLTLGAENGKTMLGIMTTTMADDFALTAFYIVALTTRPSCDNEVNPLLRSSLVGGEGPISVDGADETQAKWKMENESHPGGDKLSPGP